MTPRTAIEKSITIWQWMLDNSCHDKSAALAACFPGESPRFDCYLCEFAGFTNEYDRKSCDCSLCPVWPTESPDLEGCGNESPYSNWVIAEYRGLSYQNIAAKAVLSDLHQALANLKES